MKFNQLEVAGLVLFIAGLIQIVSSSGEKIYWLLGLVMVLAASDILVSDKYLQMEERIKKIEDVIIKEESE